MKQAQQTESTTTMEQPHLQKVERQQTNGHSPPPPEEESDAVQFVIAAAGTEEKYIPSYRLSLVCTRLNEQCIVDVSQLEQLTMDDWKTHLEGTMGLGAAVMRRLAAPPAEEEQAVAHQFDPTLTCPTKCFSFPAWPLMPSTFRNRLGVYKPEALCPMPFVFRPKYMRAVLHAKSGKELKELFTNIMSQMVVVSSLFITAAVSLWGAFPWGKQEIPEGVVLSFNSLVFAATMSWTAVFLLSATAYSQGYAVSANQFKHYCSLSLRGMTYLWFLLPIAIITFLLASLFLFIGRIDASFDGRRVRREQIILIVVPTCLAIICVIGPHICVNYITRLSYHGGLLIDDDSWKNTSGTTAKTADDKERELETLVHQQIENDDEMVIARYARAFENRSVALQHGA